MRKDGAVSLWIGVVDSAQILDDFTSIRYSEDGDFLGSEFTEAFRTGCYDEDFGEIASVTGTEGFPGLLKGCSYEEIVVPRFVGICGEDEFLAGGNAVVLLYNFEYEGTVEEARARGVHLRYVGTVGYR